MHAASQLSGRGPTGVDVALYLHVNQKSDYDDMMSGTRKTSLANSVFELTPQARN